MPCHELYSMIHVPRLEDANAAELFLGIRIGTVRSCDFAVLPIQGQGEALAARPDSCSSMSPSRPITSGSWRQPAGSPSSSATGQRPWAPQQDCRASETETARTNDLGDCPAGVANQSSAWVHAPARGAFRPEISRGRKGATGWILMAATGCRLYDDQRSLELRFREVNIWAEFDAAPSLRSPDSRRSVASLLAGLPPNLSLQRPALSAMPAPILCKRDAPPELCTS